MARFKARDIIILWFPLFLFGCSGMKPTDLGCIAGKLAPCPNSPNCVSSQSQDRSRHVDPLAYRGSFSEARQRLLSVLRNETRIEVLETGDRYLHVTFTSALFRFVDDVEFCFDTDANLIHVRSASRTGYFDFGVNRKRIERIRNAFSEGERTTDGY